jgi:hypothetical protein
MTEYFIGADESIYQPTYDGHAKAMKDNGGSFTIVRSSQGASFTDDSLDEHVANARNAGLKLSLYHWIDTQTTAQRNADYLSFLMDKEPYKDIEVIWGDHEQWWDWYTWSLCYELKQIPVSEIIRLPANQINDVAAGFFDKMKTRWSPGKKLGVYTERWFNDGYVTYPKGIPSGINSWSWASGLYKWYAFYTNWGAGALSMTWAEFKVYISKLTRPQIPTGWDQEDWDIWQISSTIKLPGLPAIDLNIMNPASKLVPYLGPETVVTPPAVIPSSNWFIDVDTFLRTLGYSGVKPPIFNTFIPRV